MAEKATRTEPPTSIDAPPATTDTPDTSAEDVTGTSSDAAFSTYAQAPTAQQQSQRPLPGGQVEQTRGTPSET